MRHATETKSALPPLEAEGPNSGKLDLDRCLAICVAHTPLFHILDDSRISPEEESQRALSGQALLGQVSYGSLAPQGTEILTTILASLDFAHLEALADKLTPFLNGVIGERIGGSLDRYPGKLESCLNPLLKLPYGFQPTQVAAEIYYRLIKNHPFFDGNKKIATAFLLEVLDILGGQMIDEELGNIALFTARSPAMQHEEVVSAIEKYIVAQVQQQQP